MSSDRGNAHPVRLLLLPPLVLGLTAAVPQAAPDQICANIARSIEAERGIPSGLVQAVTLAETGRWDPAARRSYAWPWTVTSKSETYYLPDKQGALAKVEELQTRGRRNIDVGCMQINLRWHGSAFTSVADALEPRANVTYGADFLSRLRVDTRSWSLATARYHSSNPDRGNAYRAKVYRLWQGVKDASRAATRLVRGPTSESDSGARASLVRRVGAPAIGGWAAQVQPATSRAAAPGAIPILRGW